MSRYARQVVLPDVGTDGQRRLGESRVVIVGVGALGCVSADLLVRAGVGRVTLIDRDVVEMTNLQRQSLFDESDALAGLPKAEAASNRLARVNSGVVIDAQVADLTARNTERALGLLDDRSRPSVVIDGTDNFETRYLLNDACVKHAVAFAYAGAVGTRATQATFVPGAACLRCVFDSPPEPGSVATCETAGVLAPVATIAAGAQAVDVIKLLIGRTDLLSATLLEFDAWSNVRRRIDLSGAKREDCPACGLRRFEFLESRARSEAGELCGQNAVQVSPEHDASLDLDALASRLAALGAVTRSRFILRFTPAGSPGVRLGVFADGRVIVQGVSDTGRARALCARYVGS